MIYIPTFPVKEAVKEYLEFSAACTCLDFYI